MVHYAVIQFNNKEEADAFAYAQKDLQVEVVPEEIHKYGHMYADVELVINEYMELTDEQIEKIDVAAIVNQLFDYDCSNYNDYIEYLVGEQLDELEENSEEDE